jgi:hypothetical protein
MKTQDILLLAVGVGIGYLAVKKYQQNKPKSDLQALPTAPVNSGNIQAECELKWLEKSSMMRFAEGAIDKAKADFMLSCTTATK